MYEPLRGVGSPAGTVIHTRIRNWYLDGDGNMNTKRKIRKIHNWIRIQMFAVKISKLSRKLRGR